jgi:hypothetical protein
LVNGLTAEPAIWGNVISFSRDININDYVV